MALRPKKISLTLLVLGIFLLPALGHSGSYERTVCGNLYGTIAQNLPSHDRLLLIQEELNARLAKAHPSLSYVLKDPDGFSALMDQRFQAQKLLHPDDPKGFDYSEVGVTALKFIRETLTKSIADLEKNGVPKIWLDYFRDWSGAKAKAEAEIALKYMRELLAETDEKLSVGKISYKDTVEISAFFSRINGYFDTKKQSLFMRNYLLIDRRINGYKPMTLDQEYEAYHNHHFQLFPDNAKSSGFGISQPSFQAAFDDNNKLGAIVIPVAEALDTDILMRLMSRERLHFAGLTDDPLQADGFFRPSGDFEMHDLRHGSAKLYRKELYLKENKIPASKEAELNLHLDAWWTELEYETSLIPDKDLREAILLMNFGIHHDRGHVIAPSVYLNLNNPVKMARELVVGLMLGSEKVAFKNKEVNMRRAAEWLGVFWKKREREEKALISKLTGN